MKKHNKLYLLINLICFLFISQSVAAATPPSYSKPRLHGIMLAHDLGYPHYHGGESSGYKGSGRIRSYKDCSRNVFEPCIRDGGSYQECNRRHHWCTYGHLRNCIRGETC